MLQLNKDSSFNYELLRNLGHSRYHGADVSEVLTAAASLRDGDVESFYDAFNNLAVRVNSQAEAIDAVKYPVSARDAFFRASTYFRAADFDKANQMIKELLGSGKAPIGLKWGIEQGIWSFCAESASDFMEKTRKFTLEGIAHLVQCPAWIGEAADDLFFYGQPEQVKEALGSLATYRSLTSVDGASHHCHVGATAYLNQILCDWFDQVTSSI